VYITTHLKQTKLYQNTHKAVIYIFFLITCCDYHTDNLTSGMLCFCLCVYELQTKIVTKSPHELQRQMNCQERDKFTVRFDFCITAALNLTAP